MKKIGVFTRPIEQGTSGSGSHLEKLFNQLEKKNKNYEIVLIHHKKSNKEIYSKYREKIVSRNPLISYFQLKKEKFDLIHYSPLTILYPVLFLNTIKVATIHGGAVFSLSSQYSWVKRLHEKIIRPYYAKKMDMIFTVSENSKVLIKEHDGVKNEKIKIIYNGVDNEFKLVDKYQVDKTKKKIRINTKYLYHISKFSERKNPWVLLRAFKKISREEEELKLIITGSNWGNKSVKEFLEKNNLSSKVIITGFLEKKEIINLLNGAEIFIFPSLYEGFGMPNLEAMACGCPVITSKIAAIEEVVGKAAILLENLSDEIELYIKIKTLLNNKKKIKKLIELGMSRAKDFSWDKSAKILLKTYQELLEKDCKSEEK